MKITFLVSILILFISCSKFMNENKLNFNQSNFNKNRKLWQYNQNLNYTFSQEYSSLTTGPSQEKVTCVVKNNVLYSTLPIKYSPKYKTIDEIYDDIDIIAKYCKESIADKFDPMKGATIKIEYDTKSNYPTKINYYGHYPKDYMGGLSSLIIISNFKIIE